MDDACTRFARAASLITSYSKFDAIADSRGKANN